MLIIEQGKCVNCGACIDECHRKALSFTDDELKWDGSRCYGCGHCMALCPREAIMLDGDGYDIMDVEEFNFASRPNEVQLRNMIMMRRSVRRFNDNDISEEDMNKILEAGKYAPTGENKQGNVFLVVKSEDARKEMLDDLMERLEMTAGDVLDGKDNSISKTLAENLLNAVKEYKEEGIDELFYGAPLFVFVFADTVQNGTIAACTMGNMVFGLRLGFCYIGLASRAFDDEMKKKYNIPENKVSCMALAIGDPDVEFFCTVPRKNPVTIIL